MCDLSVDIHMFTSPSCMKGLEFLIDSPYPRSQHDVVARLRNAFHYTATICACARASRWEIAMDFFEELSKKGFKV